MEIASYDNLSNADALAAAWDRLAEQELAFVPSFAELRHHLEATGAEFRLIAVHDNSRITAVACFIYADLKKRYEIASRKLLHLPVKTVLLYASCVLGRPGEDVIRKMFMLVVEASRFDLIDVGEIFVASPLHNAITSLGHGILAWRVARKDRTRWMIRLPGSFDEYFSSLRESVQRHIGRDFHRLERERPVFRVIQRPEEVEIFLRDAEDVSRLTYQWKLGYGFRNDEGNRQKFARLANGGTLRCYLLYLHGKPCAFGWGELCHRTFIFNVTGYDPQHKKLSPGTTLMLRMIRDLIENADCEIFDFLWGGEDGYKSRLATISVSCAPMQLLRHSIAVALRGVLRPKPRPRFRINPTSA